MPEQACVHQLTKVTAKWKTHTSLQIYILYFSRLTPPHINPTPIFKLISDPKMNLHLLINELGNFWLKLNVLGASWSI